MKPSYVQRRNSSCDPPRDVRNSGANLKETKETGRTASTQFATGCHCCSWLVKDKPPCTCVIHRCCNTTGMGLEVFTMYFDKREKRNILKASLCKITIKADD